MRRWVLVRHTRPDIGGGVCYGRTDLELAVSWPLDIERCLSAVPSVRHVISSPALRCRRLAEAIGRRDRISVRTDARLLELNFGTWEGVPWDAIPRVCLDRWAAEVSDYAPGGGESLRQLWGRVRQCREDTIDHLAGAVAVVSHHGPLRVLAAQSAGGSMQSSFDYHLAWGGVLQISEPGPKAAM